MLKKYLALFLVLAMMAVVFAGCANKAEEPAVEESAAVEEAPVEESAPAEAPAEGEEAPAEEEVPAEPEISPEYPVYPISDGEVLTYFAEFPGFLASNMETMQEMPSYIRAAEITGVDLQFQSVSQTAMTEQFKLM